MSVFRCCSQLTLKLLNHVWRNKSNPPLSPSTAVFRTFLSSSSSCKFSSANPKEEEQGNKLSHSNPQVSKDQDPFGIEDITSSSEKANSLVQGFYGRDGGTHEDSPPPPKIETAKQPPPSKNDTSNDLQSRLAEYDSWIRQREQMDNFFDPDGNAVKEAVRETNFGKIRIDSENPGMTFKQRPRQQDFRKKGYSILDGINKDVARDRERPRKGPQTEEDLEPVVETIAADSSKRMRASDFIKQLRNEEKEENKSGEGKDNEEVNRSNVIIKKIIRPKQESIIMDQYHQENEEITKAEAHMEPHQFKMPTEYCLPDYNAITKDDVWNILRKTVVFQNDFILGINKPSGIPCHDSAIDCRHYIIQFLDKFAALANCEQVYPLHRLDKETTGVMLFAKSKKIAAIIKKKFANRQISKVYLAVTKLCPNAPEGTIKIPIGEGLIPGTNKYRRVLRPDLREFGIKPTTRECVEGITNYKVVNSIREAAFLELEPVTGAKHQLRVHLGLGLGCPVIGDHKYSHRDRLAPQRLPPLVLHRIKVRQSKAREMPLHLHCNRISFTLPKEFTNSTEPVYIHANIPLHMRYTLKRLGLIR